MTRSPIVGLLKDVTPPALWRVARAMLGDSIRFDGPYRTWAEARAQASGYDAPRILEKVREAALRVKNGEAAYERDSATFVTASLPHPVAAALMLGAALRGGRLDVLDFGGSLGSLYGQCRPLLDALPDVHWRVVEQPHFVAAGRADFQDSRLEFFASIAECTRGGSPGVVVLSSVLQYLEDPYAVLQELGRLGAAIIVIDRTPFTTAGPDVLAVQKVSSVYPASYPAWILDEQRVLATLDAHHDLLLRCDSAEGCVRSRGIVACYRGMILKRRDSAGAPRA
jgi:putative methyltransferase (TIGR04325 family)